MPEFERDFSQEFNIEQEDDPEVRKVFEILYDDLDKLNLNLKRFIQGGKFIDVTQIENTGAHRNRPFIVLQVDSNNPEDEKDLIYKLRSEPDKKGEAKKEISFLKNVVPLLNERMPEEIKEKVRLPVLESYRDEGDYPFSTQEFFEGQIVGDTKRINPNVLNEEDIDAVAIFIRYLHDQLPVEQVQSLCPEIPTIDNWPYAWYEYMVPRQEENFRKHLGVDYYKLLVTTLENKRDFVENTELNFVAGDINPSNIIKMPDGKLGFYDWERIEIFKAPALDYGFMFATLWNRPDLQRNFLNKAIALNQDIPDFEERLRLDFIFVRGSGLLQGWSGRIDDPDKETRKLAQDAVNVISQQLKDALDIKGIWAEEKIDE